MRGAAAFLALFLMGCGGGGSKQGYQLDAELASAIPADTVALGGGRWDLIQQSPLFARLRPMLPTLPQFGFDPSKDVKEFAAAYNGRDPLLLISGTFRTQDVLNKLAAEPGAQRSDYHGKPVVSRGEAGVAALSAKVLAAGPLPRLREAVDRVAAGAKLDERWAAGLRTLPAGAQLFLLTSGGATLNLPRGSNLGNLDKILGSVDSLSAWADFSKSVHLAATASARDANAAKQLHTQLRGMIGLGRLSTPDDKPELLKFYDAIQTKLDDRKIDVDVDMPESVLDTLLKQVRP